jgi:peptidoglycan/LPS O-acetylase OafA/YrhL
MSPGTSVVLNASRWVAAFFVVFKHVFGISMANVGDPSLLLRGGHFFSGFGDIAVIVFFVISGFLVGGRTILKLQYERFRIIDYFVHRFSRIYTVLIPALIVGFILDRSGIEFFNASGIYTHPDQFYNNSFGNDIATHLSLSTFVGNLMQLQEIIVPSLGSNGPLWSLANEWWYYVLFGFCMIAYRPGRLLARVVACAAVVAMIMALPLPISLWFVVWGVGVAVAVLDRYWAGWPFFVGATIAVVCFVGVRWADHWLNKRGVTTDLAMNFAKDLAVALGYSALLVCAKNLKKPRDFWSLNGGLASFSYTVYLVHFPAMVFVAAFLQDVFSIGFSPQLTVATMIYAGALLAFLYGYAWIFAAFTEAHTNTVRSRLRLVIPSLLYRTTLLLHREG